MGPTGRAGGTDSDVLRRGATEAPVRTRALVLVAWRRVPGKTKELHVSMTAATRHNRIVDDLTALSTTPAGSVAPHTRGRIPAPPVETWPVGALSANGECFGSRHKLPFEPKRRLSGVSASNDPFLWATGFFRSPYLREGGNLAPGWPKPSPAAAATVRPSPYHRHAPRSSPSESGQADLRPPEPPKSPRLSLPSGRRGLASEALLEQILPAAYCGSQANRSQ